MAEEKIKSSEYARLWENVRNELLKREMSANKVAVLEMEKIFKKIMEDKNLPGKNLEEQIENYAKLFSNHDKLKYSRAMYKKIVTKPGFDISEDDTKEIIGGYRDAILDLEKIDFKKFPLKEKIGLFLKRNFYNFPKKAKMIIVGILVLSVLTFILTETESGRLISAYLVGINNYFFYKIIPTILIMILICVIAIAAFYAYQNKKK
jgi:hypothetical protein